MTVDLSSTCLFTFCANAYSQTHSHVNCIFISAHRHINQISFCFISFLFTRCTILVPFSFGCCCCFYPLSYALSHSECIRIQFVICIALLKPNCDFELYLWRRILLSLEISSGRFTNGFFSLPIASANWFSGSFEIFCILRREY